MKYVVIAVEHMRDGSEDCARCFATERDALAWIDKLLNGFPGDNYTFQVFELGRELKLTFDKIMEPQPAKEVKKVVMIDDGVTQPHE